MVCVNIARSGNRNIFLSLEANMATMCIIFNLLGLATAVAGALTAVDIFPAFIGSGLTSPALVTAVFWWAISIVLLLSGIAFGIYQSSERQIIRYDRELPPQP